MTKDMLQVTNYTVFDCLSSQSRQRGVIPSVRDQERHALFFDKFYQVGNTTRGVREGTGLGLSISREIRPVIRPVSAEARGDVSAGRRFSAEPSASNASRSSALLPEAVLPEAVLPESVMP